MQSWTDTEKQQLADLYPMLPTDEVARRLGRSVNAVRNVAYKHGLLRGERRTWRAEEDEYIRNHWNPKAVGSIAEHLGRTEAAVRNRAVYLRATKKKVTPVDRGRD